MAVEVLLPKLGMNMESATIVRWLKQQGDAVATGEVLAEVETDKTTTDLEAETAGVLRRQLVGEGQQVTVNQAVALIGTLDEPEAAISAQAARILSASVEGAHTPRHVDEVYQAWKHPHDVTSPTLDGAGLTGQGVRETAVSPAMEQNAIGVTRAPRPRFDPDQLRAKLGLVSERPSTPASPASPASIVGTNGHASPSRSVPAVTTAPAAQVAKTKIAIYGAGLGAKQLLEVTRHLQDVEVVGIVDDNPSLAGATLAGKPVLGGFSALAGLLANGSVEGVVLSFHSEVRRKVHRRLVQELGARIVPLVDPRAMIGMDCTIGAGALIEAGAIVGPGTIVGEGVIVDVGAVVAHDCSLGAFSHLSPGCRLSGVVSLTENVMVGVGASINSTVTVGRNVIIAPGAAVMNDLPDDVVASGVPAKTIGASRRGVA